MDVTAPNLIERTTRAVEFGLRTMATDLASFLDALPQPEDPTALAYQIEDATDTYMRALSYSAAHTYALCALQFKDLDDAGRYYRRDDVQQDLKARALRVAMAVMTKG